MPIVTRAAAVRSKIIGVSDASLDEVKLPATSVTKSTTKTISICELKQKQKERATDSTIDCSKPETCFESQNKNRQIQQLNLFFNLINK